MIEAVSLDLRVYKLWQVLCAVLQRREELSQWLLLGRQFHNLSNIIISHSLLSILMPKMHFVSVPENIRYRFWSKFHASLDC